MRSIHILNVICTCKGSEASAGLHVCPVNQFSVMVSTFFLYYYFFKVYLSLYDICGYLVVLIVLNTFCFWSFGIICIFIASKWTGSFIMITSPSLSLASFLIVMSILPDSTDDMTIYGFFQVWMEYFFNLLNLLILKKYWLFSWFFKIWVNSWS